MKKLFYLICIVSFSFGFEFDLSSQNSPLKGVTALNPAVLEISINLENDNAILGADYDSATKQFALVSKENEFYITDENFKPLRYAKHDRHFMLEMEKTVGATWYKSDVGMISYNKSFVIYEPIDINDEKEQNEQWKHLLKGYDKWKLKEKNRFFTLRAKQQYILGFDYDESKNIFLSVSVPNDVRDYWSVAVFDGDDKMILEEYIPKIGGNLSIDENRNLGEFYIVGVDILDDCAYLLSKNYSTILKLDINSKSLIDAYSFANVPNPVALSIKDNKFYIFSRNNKENKVYIFDMK